MHEQKGELARLSEAIAARGGNFVAFGTFTAQDPENRMVTFKVEGMDEAEVRAVTEPLVDRITDIRTTSGVVSV